LEAAGEVEMVGAKGSERVKSEERTHPLQETKSQRVGHPKSSHCFKGVPPARRVRHPAQRFYDDIAGSRLVITLDRGHVPHEKDSERTAAAVIDFLQVR
jgi:pimeloyl-ACP methyl ester carboxylesterase